MKENEIQKFFQLKQGELARRQGIETYNSPPSPLLEDLLPSSLIITNPDIDFGFMDARARIDFEEIQKNAYETEINIGFMYNENIEVYYVEYYDSEYGTGMKNRIENP